VQIRWCHNDFQNVERTRMPTFFSPSRMTR
jgi:hypothetical protein